MSLARILGILCLLGCTEPCPSVLFAQQGDCTGLNVVRLGEIPGLGFVRGFADLNHNGLVDIVGSGPPLEDLNGDYRLKIFEQTNDSRYAREVYAGEIRLSGYDHSEWVGDSDGNGLMEIAISRDSDMQNLYVYESPDPFSYPTPDSANLKWHLRMWAFGFLTYQTVFVEDLDGDGLREFVFGSADSILQKAAIFIWEWDRRNSYREIGRLVLDENYGDKLFGDFDGDGLNEIIVGDTRGKIYGFETTGNDSFYQHWSGDAFLQNATRGAVINDADQDGKLEFIISGASFEHGYKLYTMFETIENNQYQVVWQDTLYEFPLGPGKIVAGDIDGDGMEEFVIVSESNLRIYRASGNNKFHCTFKLEYGGRNLTTYDVNQNGYGEILYGTRPHQLLEYTPIVTVEDKSVFLPLTSFELQRNYPNPFNASTLIAFNLRSAAQVQLTVYDFLGRRIRSLAIGAKEAGYHIVLWDGTTDDGQNVPSGIYIYSLSVGEITKTRKMLLFR